MCGIIGGFGALYKKEETAVAELLFVDSLRGVDSTGLATITWNQEVKISKSLGNGGDFLANHQGVFSGKALIGHNRYATKGKVSIFNAHPFQYGNITGVHNGTLISQSLLPDYQNFVVDSENIYYSMHKIGIKETLEKLYGAYALVWYDKGSNSVNMARNSERPLHYCFTKDRRSVFFASEAKMLDWILTRNKIEFTEIISLVPGVHMEFSLNDIHQGVADPEQNNFKIYVPPTIRESIQQQLGFHKRDNVTEFPKKGKAAAHRLGSLNNDTYYDFFIGKEVVDDKGSFYMELYPLDEKLFQIRGIPVEVRCYAPPFFKTLAEINAVGNYISARLVNFIYDKHGKEPHVIILPNSVQVIDGKTDKEVDKKNVAKEEIFYVGYQGRILNEEAYKKATKAGCAWCGDPLDPKNDNTFASDDVVLCPECTYEPGVLQYLDVKAFADKTIN